MGLEDFIEDALYSPNDYVAYHVGRELAKLHPQKVIVERETGFFDLEAFVRAEKCTVISEKSIFNHIKTIWDGPGTDPTQRMENSWLNVLWRGELFDVVLVTWAQSCYRTRHHWIVADNKKFADEFFAEVCDWSAEVRGEVLVFHDGEWIKNKQLFDAIKTSTFDNVILRGSLKQEIQNDFAQFFASREVYEQHCIPWKRGVLFIGPPGNGKTHTLKALINQLDQPCLYVKSFKTDYSTDQENMRWVFKRARLTTPCLLVLEDIDSMIDDESRSFFLNELDGFETNTGVVIIATTNHPNRLDPAILNRPSRFDRKYYFHQPAAAERRAYVRKWNEELQFALRLSETAVTEVVVETENFSFAYMKELFLSAMMHWMAKNGDVPMGKVILFQAAQLRKQMEESVS